MISLSITESDRVPSSTITSKVKQWNVAPGVVPSSLVYFRIRGGQGYIIGVPADTASKLLKEKDATKLRKMMASMIVPEMQAARSGMPSPGKMLLLMQSGDSIAQVTQSAPGMGKRANLASYVVPTLTGAAVGTIGTAATNYAAGRDVRQGLGRAALVGGAFGAGTHGLGRLSSKVQGMVGKSAPATPLPTTAPASQPQVRAPSSTPPPPDPGHWGGASWFDKGASSSFIHFSKIAAELSTRARNRLGEGEFALPGRRYPIHDRPHARNALARVAQHGTASEQSQVQKAVHARFPDIGDEKKADSPSSKTDWQRATPLEKGFLLSGLGANLGALGMRTADLIHDMRGKGPLFRERTMMLPHAVGLASLGAGLGLRHLRHRAEKKAGMPFPEQDRPEKVKEIYRALKREHPEMPAEMKARIAARQGKRGKQHQGPPYKGPIQKVAYGGKEHRGLAGVTAHGAGAGGEARQLIQQGALATDKGIRHPFLPHTDPLHAFAGSQTRGQIGRNVAERHQAAVHDIAQSIAGSAGKQGLVGRLKSGTRGVRGLMNLGDVQHTVADISAHYDKPRAMGATSPLRGILPKTGYGGILTGAHEHINVEKLVAGAPGAIAEIDKLNPSASHLDRQAVARSRALGSTAKKQVVKKLVSEHGMHPEEAARHAQDFFASRSFSPASQRLGQVSRDLKYAKSEVARAAAVPGNLLARAKGAVANPGSALARLAEKAHEVVPSSRGTGASFLRGLRTRIAG